MPKQHQIRPIRIEGDIGYVTLTKGKIAIIDAADAPIVGKHNWYTASGSKDFYAATAIWLGSGKKRIVHLHNLIMQPPAEMRVDHRNADTMDYRRANLRIVTHAQNMQNRGWFRNNKSGVKGVFAYNGRWRAGLRANGKYHWLGDHPTKEAAAAAYEAGVKVIHGEFRPGPERLTPPGAIG